MICGTVGYDFSVGAFAVLMISPVVFAIGNLLLRLGVAVEIVAGKAERIPQTHSQLELWAATRPHERGVASNRGSALPR